MFFILLLNKNYFNCRQLAILQRLLYKTASCAPFLFLRELFSVIFIRRGVTPGGRKGRKELNQRTHARLFFFLSFARRVPAPPPARPAAPPAPRRLPKNYVTFASNFLLSFPGPQIVTQNLIENC